MPGRGLSPPPGDFRGQVRPGHPAAQGQVPGGQQLVPSTGRPLGPAMDFSQLPTQMQPQRPMFPGYPMYPHAPAAPFMGRPPPFMPGYGMPVPPMGYGMAPHFHPFGFGHFPHDDPYGKGRGKGHGRKRKLRRREPRSPPPKFNDDLWEEHRSDTGLRLIGDMAPAGATWDYKLRDEGRRSFVGFMASPVSHDRVDHFFRLIFHSTQWLQPTGPFGTIPRKTAWVVANGCHCTYRYGGVEVQPQAFPPWMTEVLGAYMPYCGITDPAQWPDSCNVNLYENGMQSVGWHSDDEALFQGLQKDIRIISLSLGQRRRFCLKLNWPEEGERPLHKLLLGNGCLCTMEGMVQKHFVHKVPKELDDVGPRINLTWRWIERHQKACPRSQTQN